MSDTRLVTETTTPVTASMLEFLRWVAARRRSYADAMEAWQTSCPRFSVWEDASIAGYITLQQHTDEVVVSLTPKAMAVVDDA
jgi:hypothetical protein